MYLVKKYRNILFHVISFIGEIWNRIKIKPIYKWERRWVIWWKLLSVMTIWQILSVQWLCCIRFLQDDHCLSRSSVSQTLWNTMLPCIFYIGMLILLLYYPAHSLRVTVSIKKEASSLFTHCWLPIILLILFTSLRLRQFFYF